MTADFLSRSGWASDIVGEATKCKTVHPLRYVDAKSGHKDYEFKKNKSLFNTPKFVSITRCELGLPSYLTAVAGAQAPDLLSLLHRFRSAGCSEPKDKIYAIRGLLEGGPNADLIEKITMDYKVPDWQIYLETAWAILTSDNNLNLLSHAAQSDMEGVENLPSWVPDWSVAESNSVIRDRTSTDEFGNETVLWHASARLRWKRQGTQGSRILAVQGNCVGVVTNVVETAEIVKNLGQIYRVFHRIRRMYSATGIRLTSDGDSTDPDMQVPTGTSRPPQSRFEALWRTLIMDRWKGLYPAPQEAGHAFARTVIFGHLYLPLQENPFAAFETTARNWEILKTLSDDEKECTNLIELYQAAWGDLPEIEIGESADLTEIEHPTKFLPNFEGTMYSGNWQEFSDAVIEDIDGYFSTWRVSQSARPLVITDTGLLGLGHGASKQGDEVWVLAGACVPFLLRKVTNGTHQVVGEAYIHGIMNGEAVVGTKSLQDVILA
ncbi:hypothetical protein FOXYS1_5894 [Fusarium oxysporum]|uniref:Heterokaryon incompatibility domain-containing protein n=1 Tax=Fusarium oxysporum TaxID=5507 RepID=A0A8H5AF47_FUSOX|nr:hypothetical protein FOXYS1_5894 [Fusarium oxysporum]